VGLHAVCRKIIENARDYAIVVFIDSDKTRAIFDPQNTDLIVDPRPVIRND
jgi:hypothetical protein